MRRILVVVAAGLFLSVMSVPRAWAFGVKDVVAMSQDGIPDSLILARVRHSGTEFQLDARDLHELKTAGVSNDVVMAMLQTEGGSAGEVAVAPWPYVSPWFIGFDFGDYGYYDAYAPYARVYAPLVVAPRYGRGGFGGRRR